MQRIVFYASVKFHQNFSYSNRAPGQKSCFIYGRRDSSRWLFTRLPIIRHIIHQAAVWIYTAAVSMAFDGSRRVFRLFLILKMTKSLKRGQIQTKTGTIFPFCAQAKNTPLSLQLMSVWILISTDCIKFLSRFVKRRVFDGILMNIFVFENYVTYYVWSSYILIKYSGQQRFWNLGHEAKRVDSA